MKDSDQSGTIVSRGSGWGIVLIQCLLVLCLLALVVISFPAYERCTSGWIVLVFVTTAAVIWTFRSVIGKEETLVLALLGALALYAHLVSQRGAMNLALSLAFGLLGFGMAVTTRHSRWPRWLLALFGYLALLPFLYGFFVKGIKLSRGGEFFGMNRNVIPRLLFMTTSLVLVLQYQQGYRLDLLLSALVVLISFLSRSRAGLLISSGLFMMTLIQEYLRVKIEDWVQHHRKLVTVVLIVSVIVLVFVGLYLFEHSRLKTEGLDSNGRAEIHLRFLKELTVQRVLFGFRPEILDGIGLHSSYYTFLAMFGLFSLVVLYALVRSGHRYAQHGLFLLGVLSLWVVYSAVESLSPFAEGDIVLVVLIVGALARPKPKTNKLTIDNEIELSLIV